MFDVRHAMGTRYTTAQISLRPVVHTDRFDGSTVSGADKGEIEGMSELSLVSSQTANTFITPVSTVKLMPFFCRKEGDEYVVGRPEVELYVTMPEIGVEVMRRLDQGLTIGEVADQLQAEDHEAPDIIDFVETLMELGLVAELNGRAVKSTVTRVEPDEGINILPSLQPRHVRWLFSTPALVVYGVLFVATGILLWRHPEHLPSSDNLFFHPWYTINLIGVLATIWPFMFIHELGHVFAARAMGVSGRMSVGRRFIALVAQYQIDNIWQLPRYQRIIIYMGGIIVNLWAFFLTLVLILWQGSAMPILLYKWLNLILFTNWYSTAWQFRFYLKTDVYFIVADLFHAKNLMEDARTYLHNVFGHVFPRPENAADLDQLPARELRFVKAYTIFYLVGYIIAILLLVIYTLPFIVKSIIGALGVVSQGPEVGIFRLTDAIVLLVMYTLYFSFLGRVFWREQTQRRARQALKGSGNLQRSN